MEGRIYIIEFMQHFIKKWRNQFWFQFSSFEVTETFLFNFCRRSQIVHSYLILFCSLWNFSFFFFHIKNQIFNAERVKRENIILLNFSYRHKFFFAKSVNDFILELTESTKCVLFYKEIFPTLACDFSWVENIKRT